MIFDKANITSTIKKLFLLITVMSSVANSVYAGDIDSGVWRDASTKLTWMRCSIGQTWTDSSCNGEAIKLTWSDAMEYPRLFNVDGYAGKKDWRLPTINELSTLRRCSNGWYHEIRTIGNLTKDLGVSMISIPKGTGTVKVSGGCANGSSKPILDVDIFPNSMSEGYWTSLPYENYNNQAWAVNFKHGSIGWNPKDESIYVRLVRSSQ